MKKCNEVILLLFMFLFNVTNIYAYSEKVIVGGDNIGITLNSDGLIVVGFYKVNDEYIGKENIKIGDSILKVGNIFINSIEDLTRVISENIENEEVLVEVKRNNRILSTKLKLKYEDDVYKTGLYIKDKVTGIGTLTYIDPVTKIYGALGHEIILSDTGKRVEIKDGSIFPAFVKAIDRSVNGSVGSKNAVINYDNKIGTVLKNSSFGIYGKFYDTIINDNLYEVAKFDEIKLGEAFIKTNINGSIVETYKVEIINIDESKKDTTKAISFIVKDEELLEKAGGIVQGMSGSPIIQDGKIIGAITNVVIDEVNRGYGVFIRTMLEEGEK